MAKDEVTITLKRTGKVSDSSLLSKRPPTGVVTDQSSWQSLWNAWRAGQEIPKVDFQNQIVLVATADGPNMVMTSSLNLTPSGDLRYEAASASIKKIGAGFGYTLLIIPRAGILSVNGQKLSAQKLASRPPVAMPSKPVTMPTPTPRLPASPSMASNIDESIRVEIQGRVRTEILSRDNSTGTRVVANGIVWELDLRDDARLINAAKQLGNDIGNIKGTLSRLNNPDRSVRWVVDVESIGPASANKSLGRSGDLAQSIPPQSVQPKIDPLSTNEIKITPALGEKSMQMNKPAAEMASKIPASRPTGFKSIVISATGGRSSLERKQIVAADGSVTLKVPKTNYSESFSLAADSLLELHQFIDSTDWHSVPRSTGVTGKGVTNFSITVETKTGTKRFFTDEASVGSQPVINKLFSLLQKPKNNQ